MDRDIGRTPSRVVPLRSIIRYDVPASLVVFLVALPLSLGIAVILAAPANGDPGVEDARAVDHAAFLASLRQAGITYNDAEQAIAAGKAVCGLIDNGETGLELLMDLRSTNPALTTDGAAQFAAIAARSYCPHQLTPS